MNRSGITFARGAAAVVLVAAATLAAGSGHAGVLPIITNVRTSVEGDSLAILYDVLDPDGDEMTILLKIAGSDAGIGADAAGVRGDIGGGIASGENRRIILGRSALAEGELEDFIPRLLAYDGQGLGGEMIYVESESGPPFFVDRYELTNEQFAAFVRSDGYDLRRLADVALEHDLTVVTDEAYEYFTYDGSEHFSIGAIPEMRGRVVSCFTFTKTYAMTGWRIGYLHAGAELIPQIKKAHIPLAICAPVVSQYAALAALQGSQDCVADFRAHYQSARDLMCARLDRLDSVFEYSKPSGSYLMFPRIVPDEGRDSTVFCKRLLREARVSTTPGIAFGPTGQGHLRLSFCVPEEEIEKAFDRMEEYLG